MAWNRLKAAMTTAMDDRWRPLRWLVAGIALGMAVVILATVVTGAVNDPNDLEDGTIVILSGRDDSIGGQRQLLINQWNGLHPDNQARIVELSALADAQHSEMLARAQADHSEVDVYNLDVTWIAEFADAGHIQRLDGSGIPTDGFLDKPLETCRYEGQLWALPFNTDVGLLYYRTDLLRDLLGQGEAPRRWEDLQAQVEQVRARTGNVVAGYVGQFANYDGLTVNALEMIWGAGGTVVDGEGNVVVDDNVQEVRAGLERLRAIAPDIPEFDEAESLQAFRAGKALFMRNWPVAHRSLVQDLEGAQAVPFGVAPLPDGSGALGGQNLAVSADSDRPRAARALIEFLTSDRSQQILFERGGLPATREVVYTDQAVRELDPNVEVLDVEVLGDALDSAKLRPTVPQYTRFSEVFRTTVDRYLRQNRPLPDDLGDQLRGALKGQLLPTEGGG